MVALYQMFFGIVKLRDFFMKNLIALFLFAIASSFACFAEETTSNENRQVENSAIQADQEEIVAQANNNTMMSPSNCTNLPPEQQTFAMQLNPSNKTMFCSSFNMDQRKAAMQMTSTMSPNGAKMTPDQSVEQVAKNNNLVPTTPRSSGGCPVR
jgi:hypothetical protein